MGSWNYTDILSDNMEENRSHLTLLSRRRGEQGATWQLRDRNGFPHSRAVRCPELLRVPRLFTSGAGPEDFLIYPGPQKFGNKDVDRESQHLRNKGVC